MSSIVTNVVDTLTSSQSSSGQVDGVNLLRAETSTAAGNPSGKHDTVSLSTRSSTASDSTYKDTAVTNRLSANAARSTRATEAKTGQQQEVQAVSSLARAQRAYASTQQSTTGAVKNSFNELFNVRQAGVLESSSQSQKSGLLSQQMAHSTPSMNVATNPTASSMLLSQQPQVMSQASQASADFAEFDSPRDVAASDEVKAS